jgi:dihydrolipoamide dehydrogenase
MKSYDVIAVGTGSVMSIVDAMISRQPKLRVAVIDKDEPGGICLTRGCIPSKILLYPAQLVRTIEEANELGVISEIKEVQFTKVMERMRTLISTDIDSIRRGLSQATNIDYYREVAEFVAPYTLKVGREEITAKTIFLCTGSKTLVPHVRGLEELGYLTSDSVLELRSLPRSVAVIGGGYIAAEFGHFLSSMGAEVTIIGRNKQFLPEEEPEASAVLRDKLAKHLTILTDCEVREASRAPDGRKRLFAFDRETKETISVDADEVLVAAGRGPLTDILHPERGGIRTTKEGWIEVDEFMETSQPNIWALGDADGRFLFKHVANYEAEVVYYNAVLKKRVRADYHAVPHAVFTYPEVAAVGMGEREAVEKLGENRVYVGFCKYEDTAKGEAMNAKDYLVKVIVDGSNREILGAHIVGPEASVLIQEIINAMYTDDRSLDHIDAAMHIHPSLSEVVQRACSALTPVKHYHEQYGG